MIGIDWGTTSFRAFRIAEDGTIRDRRASPRGIMNVPDGRFGETLREEIGPWLAAGETQVLLSGMIGSRQGWKEAPYIACPAGPPELAAALVDIPFDWGRVKLVPGLSATDEAGVAEVMRGEETQVVGVLAAIGGNGIACLPGTHSKWARVEDGRIVTFTTHMTGETFAALRGHTILSRMMREGPADGAPFDAGVQRSGDPGGLLHHVFGVRALTLAGRLAETDSAAYLSGILVGHEVRAALAGMEGTVVHVIGAPELTSLYARAISACGAYAERHDGEAAARGHALIGEHAAWT
jgi:2-dehydro-3-deoxygalactonokinase